MLKTRSKCNSLTAIGAALALSAGMASPAYADTLPLDLEDDDPELNALCVLAVSPASSFTVHAYDVELEIVDEETTGGDPVIVGNGSPTLVAGAWRDAHLHNNAGDIFAYRDYSTVYASATQSGGTSTETTYQYSFKCHIHKSNPSKTDNLGHVGYQSPPGLEDTSTYYSDEFSVIDDDSSTTTIYNWVDPDAAPVTKDTVICIYGRRTGWRAQNGYDGSLGTCGTTFFNSLNFPSTTETLPRPKRSR